MSHRTRIVLYLVFLAANLVQAWLTPIAKDEAYYWMYAQNLDWGFFDHPPFAAAMIWLGSSVLGGALGVRLVTTLLLTLSLPVIWATLDAKSRQKPANFVLFLLMVAAVPVFNIYGFITTPDAPLLFFAALYLWAFKRFLRSPNVKMALLLGLFMAGMGWSKYQGVLVVAFTVLANWRVLKQRHFYLAAAVSLALLIPHLLWQYSHEFLTFSFHLGDRAKDAMQFHNVTQYFVSVFLILNPIVLPPFLYSLFREWKLVKREYRTEVFLFLGFLIFFALSTAKGHVEPHWVAVAAIPMVQLLVVLGHHRARTNKVWRALGWVSLPLVLAIRILLTLPLDLPTEFHRHKARYFQTIHNAADGAGVIFTNTYAMAAKYTFYTGDAAWTYNNIFYRANQYDLWDIHQSYQGKEAFFIHGWTKGFFDTLTVEDEHVYYKRIPDFQLPQSLQVEVLEVADPIIRGESNRVRFRVHNISPSTINMHNPVVPLSFSALLLEGTRKFYTRHILITTDPGAILPGESLELVGHFRSNAPRGKYRFGIGVKPGKIPEVLGSAYQTVVVQ